MQFLLPPSPILVYGAYLRYGSAGLSDSPLNLSLSVWARERVFCLQPEATGPVPTSIEWYNPQGQLVSRDSGDEVNQASVGSGKTAVLTFRSYQQSQRGAYECRVVGPGNNLESLPVCIGEWQACGDGCGLLSRNMYMWLCLVSQVNFYLNNP